MMIMVVILMDSILPRTLNVGGVAIEQEHRLGQAKFRKVLCRMLRRIMDLAERANRANYLFLFLFSFLF